MGGLNVTDVRRGRDAALEQSKRKGTGQLIYHSGYEGAVCLQKNEAVWKGCAQGEGQRDGQEMIESEEEVVKDSRQFVVYSGLGRQANQRRACRRGCT